MTCTPHSFLSTVLQSCTTPYQFDIWRIADVSRSDVILHLCNQTQCQRALLHNVSLTCTRMQVYKGKMYNLGANCTQCYRAVLYYVNLICGKIEMYTGQM